MGIQNGASIELLEGRILVDPSELLRRSRATNRDVVVLSGTLLEGFGNLYSDLDLYVIGDHLPTNGPDVPAALVVREDGRVRRINETLTSSANILLDVQYYTFRELDTLARSLNALYLESRQSTKRFRKTLHHEDEDLIHKLLTGKVLQDGTDAFDAHKTFDPGMFCFLKYRNEVGGYPEFRDLVGSWTAGDLDTCLYNTRGYLISQISGMMFLAGSTNPRPKWFIRKLVSMGAEYSKLRDDLMLWMYGARRTEAQKREAVETACDLIDATYSHHRWLLDTNPRYFCAQEALALTDREFSQRGTYDKDTMAEWKLRHRMFDASEPPLISQLKAQGREKYSGEFSYAQMR
jgi:hypothetical protein